MGERRSSGELSGGAAGAAGARAALPVAWRLGRAQPGDAGAGAGAGKGRGEKGGGASGGRRKARRGHIHRAQGSGGNVNVWAVPSRGLAVLKNRFADRVGAGTSADGLPNYDHCSARQRDHAHEVREAEKAAMTGDPAAAVLHERLGGALAEARACAAGRAGGAFPGQAMGDRAAACKARILGIAEGLDKAGFRRAADGIRRAADGTVECVVRPGLTATTHKSEQGMREFVGAGARARSCRRARQEEVLGREGAPRYAAQQGPGPLPRNGGGPGGGSRARVGAGLGRRREGGGARRARPGRNARRVESAVRRASRAAGSRGSARGGRCPARCGRCPDAGRVRSLPNKLKNSLDPQRGRCLDAGRVRSRQGAARRRRPKAPQGAPRKSQRRLAASATPGKAAPGKAAPGKAAPGKAAKSLPDAQPPHPATARAAPAAAPSGPGPPPAGGPRNPVAAA